MSTTTHNQPQPDDKPDGYAQAQKLAEDGNYEPALAYFQDYLAAAPDDAEALNDVGAILFTQGQTGAAIEHFEKAYARRPDHAEIVWNLCEASLAGGRPEKAAALFAAMDDMGLLNADVLNRTARVFLDADCLAEGTALLEQSLALAPEQALLEPMIEVLRSQSKNDPS